jgi:hypothetical protein
MISEMISENLNETDIIKTINQTIVTLDNIEIVNNTVKKEVFELLSLELDILREEVVKESKKYL